MTVLKHKFNHSPIIIPKNERGKKFSEGTWHIQMMCANIRTGIVEKGDCYVFNSNLYQEAKKLIKEWGTKAECEIIEIKFEKL